MMDMRCAIDLIGMLVIGCSVALDGKWMFLFIMLACWLLGVRLAMMVIGCPIGLIAVPTYQLYNEHHVVWSEVIR